MEKQREEVYYRAMLRRLWLVISLLWAAFMYLFGYTEGEETTNRAVFWIAFTPFILGAIVPLVADWVIRGGSPERGPDSSS